MIFRRLRQTGDTIVEVLIAIGIISLIITAAFVTANRSYLTMQDAQERGNALKLLERETEALKAYNVTNHAALAAFAPNANFCMTFDASGSPQTKSNNNQTDGTNPCAFAPDASQATAGAEPAYLVRISKDNTPIGQGGILFTVQAQWDSILADGKTQIQMQYGVYPQ